MNQYPRDQSMNDIQGYQYPVPRPIGQYNGDQYINNGPNNGYVNRGRREDRNRSRERSRDRQNNTSRTRTPSRQRRDYTREDQNRTSSDRDSRFYNEEEARDPPRGEDRYEKRHSDPGYGGHR